jgi:hypothetical protein
MPLWRVVDASCRNRDESKLWYEFMSNGLGVALGLRQRCSQLRVSYNINTRADRERVFREEDCCTYRRSPYTRNESFHRGKGTRRRIETHPGRREIREPKLCLVMSAGQRREENKKVGRKEDKDKPGLERVAVKTWRGESINHRSTLHTVTCQRRIVYSPSLFAASNSGLRSFPFSTATFFSSSWHTSISQMVHFSRPDNDAAVCVAVQG